MKETLCELNSDQLVKELQTLNPKVTNLVISDLKINETAAKAIANILKSKNYHITSIVFRQIEFDNKFSALLIINALKRNETITSIGLPCCGINDTFIPIITTLCNENNNIKSIDLSYNELNDAGAEKIAEMLKINTFLESVELEYCYIGNKGAKDIRGMLEKNISLNSINLELNVFGDDGLMAITDGLEKNHTLSVIKLGDEPDEGDFFFSDKGVKYFAKMLEENDSLTDLSIHGSNTTAESLTSIKNALCKNKTLTKLSYADSSQCKISDPEITKLLVRNQQWQIVKAKERAARVLFGAARNLLFTTNNTSPTTNSESSNETEQEKGEESSPQL